MPKKLVIHATFIYVDPSTKQRTRAFRGDTINVTGKDLERGTKHGAFGTQADLVPPGLDDGVVELSPEPPTGTPVVPLVSKSALLEATLRDRLGVEPGASEAQVLAALNAALTPAPTETAPAPAEPTAPAAGPVVVELPPESDSDAEAQDADEAEPVESADDDEGQADDVEPPPLAATQARWVAHAVRMGMPEGEAKALKKGDLIKRFGKS